MLPDVGDARSIWFEILEDCPGQDHLLCLCLGTYAPPPNHLPAERHSHWRQRWQELVQLRDMPRYRNVPVIVTGDLNVHVPEMSHKDGTYHRPIDREIWNLPTDRAGFGLLSLNPKGIPTHSSGSVLDFVLYSGNLELTLGISEVHSESLDSDHACLVTSLVGRQCATTFQQEPTAAKWMTGKNERAEAMRPIHATLLFAAGWSGALASNEEIRTWVAHENRKNLRQRLLDLVVWRRTTLGCGWAYAWFG